MDARERYERDPYFHALVDLFLHEFERSRVTGAGLTPSEIREASGLAWQIYAARHPHPILVDTLPTRRAGPG